VKKTTKTPKTFVKKTNKIAKATKTKKREYNMRVLTK
jgi:hypothetical protein